MPNLTLLQFIASRLFLHFYVWHTTVTVLDVVANLFQFVVAGSKIFVEESNELFPDI